MIDGKKSKTNDTAFAENVGGVPAEGTRIAPIQRRTRRSQIGQHTLPSSFIASVRDRNTKILIIDKTIFEQSLHFFRSTNHNNSKKHQRFIQRHKSRP